MTRPSVGTMPGPASFDTERRLDFLAGLRVFNLTTLKAPAAAQIQSAIEATSAADIAATAMAAKRAPAALVRNRFMRSMQEQMWHGCAAAYEPLRDWLADWMDEAVGRGPGSLTLDPLLAMPGYYTGNEFHIQPGSYFGDDCAGPVYHYGTKVFYLGMNDDDQFNGALAHAFEAPERPVQRVLDLGCSIGQSATALARRFADAQIDAIDLSAPLLRYAHARAVDLGAAVHFRQADATAVEAPDGAYDIVHAMILFHELPAATAATVVDEAWRLLRPGGHFVVVDFPHQPPDRQATVLGYDRWCDAVYNGEPFAYDFVFGNFASVLEHRFGRFDTTVVPPGLVAIRVCRKT